MGCRGDEVMELCHFATLPLLDKVLSRPLNLNAHRFGETQGAGFFQANLDALHAEFGDDEAGQVGDQFFHQHVG